MESLNVETVVYGVVKRNETKQNPVHNFLY